MRRAPKKSKTTPWEALIEVGEESGILEGGEAEMVRGIVDLDETTAREIMTPSGELQFIHVDTTVAEASRLVLTAAHTRIPVYEENGDNVLGILHARDLLKAWERGEQDDGLRPLLRDAHFVHESDTAADLLQLMRQTTKLALVMDEYGGIAGLVTLEDLFEEIVGEIRDEDDRKPGLGIVEHIDGSWELPASEHVDLLEQQFDVAFTERDFDTIGGWIVADLGRVPRRGERLRIDGLTVRRGRGGSASCRTRPDPPGRSWRRREDGRSAARRRMSDEKLDSDARDAGAEVEPENGAESGVDSGGESSVDTRSGFVALVGWTNVGKSTLLNQLVGAKLAAVADVAQTTRTRILGGVTDERGQILFVDTPGFHRPRSKMNRNMVDVAEQALMGVDVAVMLLDASKGLGPGDRRVAAAVLQACPTAILALNKIDRVPDKGKLLPMMAAGSELGFADVIPISAASGDGCDALVDLLYTRLPEMPPLYPEDFLTDQPERVIAAEFIREKLLHQTRQELPHVAAVMIDGWNERADGLLELSASILVERDSHKKIVIGKAGERLKSIGSAARFELEQFLERRVFLQLWVKVRDDWRNRDSILHELGLG